jgi:hypothetical protein
MIASKANKRGLNLVGLPCLLIDLHIDALIALWGAAGPGEARPPTG